MISAMKTIDRFAEIYSEANGVSQVAVCKFTAEIRRNSKNISVISLKVPLKYKYEPIFVTALLIELDRFRQG